MERLDAVQALRDSGCTEEQIQRFERCRDGKTGEEPIRLLRQYRLPLLHRIRENERQLDCLDYLIHQMEKERKTKQC